MNKVSAEDAGLKAWSDEQDRLIPASCPFCGGELGTIRYVREVDVVSIRATGAVNKTEWFRALCPNCDHRLAMKIAGQEHAR